MLYCYLSLTHTHSYSHTHTLVLTHTHSYSHTHTPERNVFTMYVAIWSFLSDVFSLLYTLLVTHTFGIIIYYQVMICKKDQEILMIIRDSFPVSAAWQEESGLRQRASLHFFAGQTFLPGALPALQQKAVPWWHRSLPMSHRTHLLCIFWEMAQGPWKWSPWKWSLVSEY